MQWMYWMKTHSLRYHIVAWWWWAAHRRCLQGSLLFFWFYHWPPWAQPEFRTCSPVCSSRKIRSPFEYLRNEESCPAGKTKRNISVLFILRCFIDYAGPSRLDPKSAWGWIKYNGYVLCFLCTFKLNCCPHVLTRVMAVHQGHHKLWPRTQAL